MAKKNTQPKPNTSAPESAAAEVSATPVEQSTGSAESLPVPAPSPSEPVATPPEGEVSGDGSGKPLDDIEIESITVVSDVDGFRRAGIAWSRTPTTVLIDDLEEAQIAALVAEPMLQVVFNAALTEKVGE